MNLFTPDNFEKDPYGHLTNQMGHVSLSLFLVYWMPWIAPWLFMFWIIWECFHFYQSKDAKDSVEDLFFELSGITVYFAPWWSFVTFAALAVTTIIRMRGE